jgi:NAD-dependent dihydropyrimidine dehydrogenase PreA subunit
MPETDYEGIMRNKIPWDPTIDYQKCTVCGKCVEFCHMNAFRLERKNGKKTTTVNPNSCVVLCRSCENICPSGAIDHPDEAQTREVINKLKKQSSKNRCDK